MILTFKLDSNDVAGIKKIISLCENLLSFESTAEIKNEAKIKTVETVSESKINLDDIRAELMKVANDKGKDVAKSLLNEFGVEKITAVKESDYEKLLQRIREVQ